MRLNNGVRWMSLAAVGAVALGACSLLPGGDGGEDGLTMNDVLGGPDYENIDYEAQNRAFEEAVAACMRNEGWEYIPVEYPDQGGVVEYTDEDERERIEREGLGIAYYALYPNGQDGEFVDGFTDFQDPNQEYLETLSESEVTAYYESLYGTEEEQNAGMSVEIDPETGDEYYVGTGWGAGCQGTAGDEVYGDDPTQDPEYWDAVSVFYEELDARVQSDSRVTKLTDEWSACMSDAGFEFDKPDDFWGDGQQVYYDRYEQIMGDAGWNDPFAGWTDEQIDDFFASASQEEIDKLFEPEPLTDDQRSQLEELLADEISIALADFECSQNYYDKMADAYTEIEAQYVAEHEDELRALAASFGAGE